MPRRRIPKYRCYKPKNLGLGVIDGKQHDLGRYGSPESVAEYNRLIQEWLARALLRPTDPGSGDAILIIDELILAFWTRLAETHYRRADGTPTGELANYRDTLTQLRRFFRQTPSLSYHRFNSSGTIGGWSAVIIPSVWKGSRPYC